MAMRVNQPATIHLPDGTVLATGTDPNAPLAHCLEEAKDTSVRLAELIDRAEGLEPTKSVDVTNNISKDASGNPWHERLPSVDPLALKWGVEAPPHPRQGRGGGRFSGGVTCNRLAGAH